MKNERYSNSQTQESENNEYADALIQISEWMETNHNFGWDEIVARFPHFEDRLNQMRPAFEGVMALAASTESANRFSPDLSSEMSQRKKPLGDFHLLREIGRGGMGVVYEAKQISLGRTVAVKVLPLAALIDRQALVRFRNEVQAVAALDHPNIVSVFSVGEDRGIHYYAMQLIRGQSLATVVRELKEKASIEGSTIEVIVKRIKDQNNDLLPNPPTTPQQSVDTQARGYSKTNCEKFGRSYFINLARLMVQAARALGHAHEQGVIHRDIKPGNLLVNAESKLFVADFGLARIESGEDVTLTGDLLGTLRYMSPEQVLANRVVIDHRTDIYSLGLTLYEIMTLHPAFDTKARPELIRQISFEDPVKPSKVNPWTPKDLETITLKAICKDPSDRYQSAGQFADDLQRFIDEKPIVASRPSVAQRTMKLMRRHPNATLASVFVLCIFVVVLGISTAVVSIARNSADEHRIRAEARTELARRAVNEMYTEVASKWLENEPELQTVQKEFLEKAIQCLQELSDGPQADSTNRIDLADSLYALGSMQSQLSQFESSMNSFRQAIENYRGKYAETNSTECLAKLAATQAKMIQVFNLQEKFSEAVILASTSILWHTDRLSALEEGNSVFGRLYLHHVAEQFYLRGQAYNAQKQVGLAEPDLRNAITMRRPLASDDAEQPFHVGLAQSLDALADLVKQNGKYEESRELLIEAVKHSDLAVKLDRRDRLARQNLAHHHMRLTGLNLFYLNELNDAKIYSERHMRIANRLVEDFGNYEYQHSLAVAHYYQGQIAKRNKDFSSAHSNFQACIKHCDDVTQLFPDRLKHRRVQAQSYMQLYYIEIDSEDPTEPERLNDQAIRIMEEVANCSELSSDLELLTGFYTEQANFYDPTDPRRIKVQEKCVQIRRELISTFPKITSFQIHMGAELNNLAGTLVAHVRYDEAIAAFRESIEFQETALAAQPDNPKARDFLTSAYSQFAGFLVSCPDKSLRDPVKAIELAKAAIQSPDSEAGRAPPEFRNSDFIDFTLATAYFQNNESIKAKPILILLSEKRAKDAGVCFALSAVFAKCNEPFEASRWYKQGCKLMPTHPSDRLEQWYETAKELLDESSD